MATACPWRCEHSDESGAEGGTQPHYPRPRNPRVGGEGQAGGRERGTETGRVWTSWPSLDTSAGHSSLDPPCGHLTHDTLSHQVTECLQDLDRQLWALREAWALRRERCEESWHLQKLRQELDQAEAWLACREGLLLDPNCGVSQCPAP